jgi:hypothetical protein
MSTYRPKQPAGGDNGGLPGALADAIASAEMMLKARDGVVAVLHKTHDDIPRMLAERMSLQAELARAEATNGDVTTLAARLVSVDAQLEESRRKRRGSIGVLLNDQKVGAAELLKAKEAIAEARIEFGESQIAEFRRALDEATARLQQLWQYGDALAAALGRSIPTSSVIRAAEVERARGPDVAITLPAPIERLGEVSSRLDSALALNQSITRSKGFDMRRDKLQAIGSTSAMQDTSGVFQVVAPAGVVCGLDLLRFEQGSLVDADLIGPGPLQRLLVARAVRRVDSLAMVTSPSAA